MSYWANRKLNELKNFAVKTKSRCIENKENVFDDIKSDSEVSKTTVQYLYVDPTFLDKHNEIRRMEGGQYQKEVYYDCKEDAEEKLSGQNFSNQQNFCMPEVLSEIENIKEFKRALKQLVFNSNNLYHTFQKAYCKTKKSRKTPIRSTGKKCKYCHKCGGEKDCQQQNDRGDMNVNLKENVELPSNKQTLNQTQEDKSKNIRNFVYNSCNTLDVASQYTTFSRPKENKIIKPTKRPEVETQTIANWLPQEPPCLAETNANQQTKDEQHIYNDLEKYAMPKEETSSSNNIQMEETSNINQTLHCYIPASTMNNVGESLEYMSNTNPISVTIPLKLQIDSHGGTLRFLDIDNKTETLVSRPTKETTTQQTNTSISLSSANKPSPMQEEAEIQMFYPSISNSGIIGLLQATAEMHVEENINQLETVEKKQQVSKETHSSTFIPKVHTDPKLVRNHDAEITQAADPKLKKSDYLISDMLTEAEKAKTKNPMPMPVKNKYVKNDMPAPQLEQLKQKAERLRAELLEEVKMALEQRPPASAIKALLEKNRVSLLEDVEPRQSTNITPVRYSLPNNLQAIPSNILKSQVLKPLPVISMNGEQSKAISKPAIPPKPDKLTSAMGLQKSTSAISRTGHINRNKRRTFIQHKLNDLLKPDSQQQGPIYSEEQRDEIISDFYKLFHPNDYDFLPKAVKRQNALYDIRLLVEREPTTARTTLTESQENFLEDIRHILNPKAVRRERSMANKFRKDIKDKILENLQIILDKDGTPADEKTREQILHDIRQLRDKGIMTSTSLHAQVQPSRSRTHRSRHKLTQHASQHASGSLIHDLIYKLDSTLYLDKAKEAKEGNSTKKKPSPTGRRQNSPSISSQD